jgi:hypothetical protein
MQLNKKRLSIAIEQAVKVKLFLPTPLKAYRGSRKIVPLVLKLGDR